MPQVASAEWSYHPEFMLCLGFRIVSARAFLFVAPAQAKLAHVRCGALIRPWGRYLPLGHRSGTTCPVPGLEGREWFG